MDLGLRGRVALVCGSTRGIGRAVARALSHEGARVAVNGRHPDATTRAAEEIEAETGHTVLPAPADVTVPDQARGAVQMVAKEFGRLDIPSAMPAALPPRRPGSNRPRPGSRRLPPTC
jgi:3-oxoacyl-[acyl-carrier protein] reductase